MPGSPDTNPVNPAGKRAGSEKPTEPTHGADAVVVPPGTIGESSPALRNSFELAANAASLGQDRTLSAEPRITKIKPEHPLGYIRPARRRPNQTPTTSEQNPEKTSVDQSQPREKKPKAIPIFTKIPSELEDVFMTMMFSLGHRPFDAYDASKGEENAVLIPGAQSRRRKLRAIVEEINGSREDPNRVITQYYKALSEIHPSTDPDMRREQQPLTRRQIELILADPVGVIAADILQTAQHQRIPIPTMNSKVVDRLTMLRDEHKAVKPTIPEPVIKLKRSQKPTEEILTREQIIAPGIRTTILRHLNRRTNFKHAYERMSGLDLEKLQEALDEVITTTLRDSSELLPEKRTTEIVNNALLILIDSGSLEKGFLRGFSMTMKKLPNISMIIPALKYLRKRYPI